MFKRLEGPVQPGPVEIVLSRARLQNVLQANSPMRTQLSPASTIRAASRAQISRGQCSG